MNNIITSYMALASDFIIREQEMCEHFKKKAEEARQRYWNACKYPRKMKKRIRKQAEADFQLFMTLSEPIHYSF